MTILRYIFIALEVVLLFNLLIGVHELGHFLAAKWRGLKVERFAIWFGKPLWKKKMGGVEYCLGWIPAGGYVSLPQMATMEAIEGKTEETAEQLPNVSPLDKIIVAFAGPLFSFGLALDPGKPIYEIIENLFKKQAEQAANWGTYMGKLAYEWGPGALGGLKKGEAKGTTGFLDLNGNVKGERKLKHPQTYQLLLMAWPEIDAMLKSDPPKRMGSSGISG